MPDKELEHTPSSPTKPTDLLTRIVDFGREVLAPSPHTPRTNLARWGEGCKPCFTVAPEHSERSLQHCPLRRGS